MTRKVYIQRRLFLFLLYLLIFDGEGESNFIYAKLLLGIFCEIRFPHASDFSENYGYLT